MIAGEVSRRVPTWVWCAGIIVLLSAGAWATWENAVRNRVLPRAWGEVETGMLYRSGQVHRNLIESTLSEHRIRTILFMSEDKANRPDVQAEAEAARKLGIERLNLPLKGDGSGDIARYADAVEIIARNMKSGDATLVHCHSGTQRTGAAIYFYRVFLDGWSPADAYREMIDAGHDPSDNKNMKPYVNEHIDDLAHKLVERGVIDRVPNPLPLIPEIE